VSMPCSEMIRTKSMMSSIGWAYFQNKFQNILSCHLTL
jgi:hypothetical protein